MVLSSVNVLCCQPVFRFFISFSLQGSSGILADFIAELNLTGTPLVNISSGNGLGIDATGSASLQFTLLPGFSFEIDFRIFLEVEVLFFLFLHLPEIWFFLQVLSSE